MTYQMTRLKQFCEVSVGGDDGIPVMISQRVPVYRFHDMVSAPPASLHDIGIRNPSGMKGGHHVVAVIVKSEMLYVVGFEESAMSVG